MKQAVLMLLALSCVGCVKHVPAPKVVVIEQVWKRECLNNAALTDTSECRGPDKHHLRCLNIAVDLKLNCEVTEVEKALPEREGKRSNK